MMKFRICTLVATFVLTAVSMIAQAAGGGSVAKPASPKPVSKPKPVVSAAASIDRLPSARAIFDKYVKAIGGREAILKFKTRYQFGTVELSPQGIKGTVETFEEADAKSLTKVSLSGIGEIIEGFDGTTAWTVNPLQGNRVKTGDELKQVQKNALFYRDLYPDQMYSKVVVKGVDKVGERSVFVVIASANGLPDDTLYFDKETGLLLRMDSIAISPEGRQAIQNYFEDYRETDGIKTPWKVRGVSPLFEIITVLTVVKNGEPVDEAKFAPPAEGI